MKDVRFRVTQSGRDWKFPVLAEVSVDGGGTWHEIPVAELTVRESPDHPTLIDLSVYHDTPKRS